MEIHPYKTINGFDVQLNMSKEEISEWGFLDGGIWTNETKTIIVGTFPPKNEYLNRLGYIHYSSPKNKFWKHIDSIYNKCFYLNKKDAENSTIRINNAKNKVEFSFSKDFGFIDIFTKIRRTAEDANDDHIISVETIFDTDIFNQLLRSKVQNFIFVYSKSRDVFFQEVYNRYKAMPKIIREYDKDNITLSVYRLELFNKLFYLCYSPIHGNILDTKRRPALKKAIERDFN
jgi:G:T/U-mismatch repair DNA glycosylase